MLTKLVLFRWPGASLIIIRGHKHLHECAYIGDDSSEELDEMMEAIQDGVYVNITKADSPTNEPELMKRHSSDVKFHSSLHVNSKNHTLDKKVDSIEITDPTVLKQILAALKEKSKVSKGKSVPRVQPTYRNATIAKGESQNFKITAPENDTNSEEVLNDILFKLQNLGERGSTVLERVNKKFNFINNAHQKKKIPNIDDRLHLEVADNYEDDIERARRRKREIIFSTVINGNEDDAQNDRGMEEVCNYGRTDIYT